MVARNLLSPVDSAASVPASPAASMRQPEALPVALPEAASAVVEVAGSVFDPRAARVRQMILENRTSREIIGEVWGTTGGDSYRKASAEYQAIVRQLIR
jgi:hypothetical protein